MKRRVLVTGHNGNIGSILTGHLTANGHDVVGCDHYMFDSCRFGDNVEDPPSFRKDIRDLAVDDLAGIEAICHLAAICNDPLGDLNPEVTDEINHLATVRLAQLAREAGVERFILSSSCSIYGASPGGWVDEESKINPVTPYGWSKIRAETGLRALASDDFSPICLRNATGYGVSPRLRADPVVNNLVGHAVTQGRVYMKSDGSPWRPLIHIEDISRAFRAVLEAPREVVHNQVFNVGITGENYQIRDVARVVEDVVPGAKFEMADAARPDIRDYRVNCDKIAEMVPGFDPIWTVKSGVNELYEAFAAHGLHEDEFLGPLMRVEYVRRQQARGLISADQRMIAPSYD